MILDGVYIIVPKSNVEIIIKYLKNNGYKDNRDVENSIKRFANNNRVVSFYFYSVYKIGLDYGIYDCGQIPGEQYVKTVHPKLKKLDINVLFREVKLKRILNTNSKG